LRNFSDVGSAWWRPKNVLLVSEAEEQCVHEDSTFNLL